jgi:nitrogen regulatory protein P-II 1
MKLIEAIIKLTKLDEVKSALKKIGIEEFRESALIRRGRQKRQAMVCRGVKYVAHFADQVKLAFIVADDSLGIIIEVIGAIAKTERRADCRINILPFRCPKVIVVPR